MTTEQEILQLEDLFNQIEQARLPNTQVNLGKQAMKLLFSVINKQQTRIETLEAKINGTS